MIDARPVFDWVRQNGEVKAVDRTLIKVMMILIRNKITLTPSALQGRATRLDLPDEVVQALVKAAESVVGKPVPRELLEEKSNV